jgi:hypothetical protein
MEDIIVTSPDLLDQAVMKYVGEIRFGLAYYSLTIDKISFGEHVFGNSYLWSPGSRYFAVQEWGMTRKSRGPQTQEYNQASTIKKFELEFLFVDRWDNIK